MARTASIEQKERCIFCDIIRQESAAGVRLVTETDRFTVIEPYAPRFPFETWILPKTHGSHYEDADAPTLQNLAWILRATIRKLEKVLERPAYNLIVHTAPVQEPRARLLSLAHRDHSTPHQGGGVRVGHGILHQSHAARGIGEVPARSGPGVTRTRCRARGSAPRIANVRN